MAQILSPGPTTILSVNGQSSGSTAGTTSQAGSWYTLHPKYGRLAFQMLTQPSTAGATISSTIYIEVSNDGTYPLATKALTIAQTGTTIQSDGGVFSSSMNGQFRYVRANLNSLSTSTAGSAGTPAVSVIVMAAPLAMSP